MSKDEVVGLVAGLLLGVVIVVGYPLAGLYLFAIACIIYMPFIQPILGLVCLIFYSLEFKKNIVNMSPVIYWLDFFMMAVGTMALINTLFIWFSLMGWN